MAKHYSRDAKLGGFKVGDIKGIYCKLVIPDNGRLTSRQELLIANAIIAAGGDCAKAAELLDVPQETASEVALRYATHINQALRKELKDRATSDAINKSVDIMKEQISELRNEQNARSRAANASAGLTRGELGALLDTVDRLIKVKQASNDQYQKCLSGLTDTISKSKLTEKAEEGLDIDNGIYAKNQQAVVDLLMGDAICPALNSAVPIPCAATDLRTNERKVFGSISEFLHEAGVTMEDLTDAKEAAKAAPGTAVIVGQVWLYDGPIEDSAIGKGK